MFFCYLCIMNIKELIESKYPKVVIPSSIKDEDFTYNGFDLCTKKYNFISSGVKRGQFFLYEHIEWKRDRKGGSYCVLHYPRIAIYLNDRLVDMAFEIDFFNVRRSWENREYTFSWTDEDGKERTYEAWASEMATEIESIIIWDDSVKVYGHWDALPGWKELRKAYQKTIWFHRTKEDNRDLLLNGILK